MNPFSKGPARGDKTSGKKASTAFHVSVLKWWLVQTAIGTTMGGAPYILPHTGMPRVGGPLHVRAVGQEPHLVVQRLPCVQQWRIGPVWGNDNATDAPPSQPGGTKYFVYANIVAAVGPTSGNAR